MELVLALAVFGAVNIFCFMIGAKVGQTVASGEKVEMPSMNPIEAIKEHREKKEAEMELDRINTIMRNIDRYDGTADGQEEVPRG